MTKYSDLDGKNVWLTGGANGIGAAMVRAFHGSGARVFFCDLDEPAGKKLATELGPNAKFEKVDLLKEKEIARWFRQGAPRSGVDVLVNNAARDPRIGLEETTVEDWDRLFAGNLRAMFIACREASPWFPSSGGAIINFSSITFHTAPARMSAYVATKGGILAFTRSLARELGPRRIRVNTLSPGWIMTDRQLKDFVNPAVKRLIKKSQCVPDLLRPEDIADVALFLASDASRAVTGQEILADRGWAHS